MSVSSFISSDDDILYNTKEDGISRHLCQGNERNCNVLMIFRYDFSVLIFTNLPIVLQRYLK